MKHDIGNPIFFIIMFLGAIFICVVAVLSAIL